MTVPSPQSEQPRASSNLMSRWRCWLYNQMARWEETSIARSLGLPPERFFIVDLSTDDGREL
jgi:hypothetical protein